jgi:hypothetical protein
MPSFTALIHARTADEQPLGRLLETLRPCDEVLVVNLDQSNAISDVARQYGANLKQGVPGVAPGAYVMDAKHDWILALLPSESLTEGLEASLFEWKDEDHDAGQTFALTVREESANGWTVHEPHTRLVNRTRVNWIGDLPKNETTSRVLEGDLLRFQE